MPRFGGAVLKWRRTHGDELKQTERHAARHVRREPQATRLKASFEQALKARFVYGQLAAPKAGDPVLVDVDAKRVVAGLREARGGNQSHVTGTVDGDVHG